MGVRALVNRAKSKLSRHKYYDQLQISSYVGLEPEKFLSRAAPSITKHYLSLIQGASSSLTGVIAMAVQSAFLPHFIVPAVFNLGFLGHYSIQIHVIRKWARFNTLKLADRSRILGKILTGIIIKLCITLLTLGHADFALIMDAITVHGNALHPNQMVALLDRAQSAFSKNLTVEGLNVVLGSPLNASQNAIGLGGEELTWTEHLSPAQITEMGFANQGNEVLSDILVEEPVDRAFESVQFCPTKSNDDGLAEVSRLTKTAVNKYLLASFSSSKLPSIKRTEALGDSGIRDGNCFFNSVQSSYCCQLGFLVLARVARLLLLASLLFYLLFGRDANDTPQENPFSLNSYAQIPLMESTCPAIPARKFIAQRKTQYKF